MTSTRNKNTMGNYAAEKLAYEKRHQEMMYIHASQNKFWEMDSRSVDRLR